MSSEWVFRKLVLPLSDAQLNSDLIEQMLATKGALNRWVASIPEHIAAAEAVIKEKQEAKDREEAEALLIKDEAAPIEDLDLTVRAYNSLKRAGIHTVHDILRPGRSEEKIRDAIPNLCGRLEYNLYRRLIDGGIADDRIPAWIPRP